MQIFEQRYLELIKSCMKNEHGFIVALISSGKEVNDIPDIYSTGTYVEITDWNTLDNSLLSITISGVQRTKILCTSSNKNGLVTASTEPFDIPVLAKHHFDLDNVYYDLVETLRQLSKHTFVSQNYSAIDYSDSFDVCFRLSELLPVSNSVKQDLLETVNINNYVEKLAKIINSLGGQQ